MSRTLLPRVTVKFAGIVLLATLTSLPAQGYDADRWKVRQSRMVLRKATVPFEGKQINIEVYTEPEHQGWGRQVATWTSRLIPAFYSEFGSPEGLDVIRIVEEPQLPSAGWNAQNQGIRIRYPSGPAVIAEQMAHYWINPKTVKPAWLQKGMAIWQGLLALRRANFGSEAFDYWREKMMTARGGATTLDQPLQSFDLYNLKQAQFQFAIAKATLFSQILQYVAGARDYQNWVVSITKKSKPIDIDDVASFINKTGKKADQVFRGWVSDGAYQAFGWDTFLDRDHDGLPDGLEALIGADPTRPDTDNDDLSDGYEYWHELSPVDRDSNGDGKFDTPLGKIAVDGMGNEWKSIPEVSNYKDGIGESSEFDLAVVNILQDGERLFVSVVPATPINDAAQYWMTLLFDFDGDRKADLYVLADNLGRVWQTRVRLGQKPPASGTPTSGLIGQVGGVYELAIPTELFEGHKNIKLNVRVDRPGAVSNIDHTGGYWHPVNITPS